MHRNFFLFLRLAWKSSILFIIFLIKYSIDSLTLKPVLDEVLKAPQNPLFLENSWIEGSSSKSTKSTLFSTKRQGSFPPSRNKTASSIVTFHFKALSK